MTVYHEITCKSACNHINSKFLPYHWDLNAYRGCTHGCRYCYAIYSHRYMESGSFFGEVFVKTNIVDQLERQLRSSSWRREIVNLGGVTDNYQEAEAQYKLMPEILKLLIRYKTPCIVSSKSDLILRDFDLLAELAQVAGVNVAQTVTCMDETIRTRLEPGGVASRRRLEVLRAFAKTQVTTGVHSMPIVPYLTDGRDNLEALYAGAREAETDYLLPGLLNLRGPTRRVFFDFIRQDFPQKLEQLQRAYSSGRLDRAYKAQLYGLIGQLRQQYGVGADYMAPIRAQLQAEPEYAQLSLF